MQGKSSRDGKLYYFSVAVVELHDPNQHINGLIVSLWCQRVRVHHGGEVCQQEQGAESLQPQLQACLSKLEVGSGYVISKPDLSDVFPPSRLYHFPNSATNWEPNVQIPKPIYRGHLSSK